MKPPKWWSALRVLGACTGALKRYRHCSTIYEAILKAINERNWNDIEVLSQRADIWGFRPKRTILNESDHELRLQFHGWMSANATWIDRILCKKLKTHQEITRLSNQVRRLQLKLARKR